MARGGVEPPSHVFQTRAVTALATLPWWAMRVSNPQPFGCKPNALPIELIALLSADGET